MNGPQKPLPVSEQASREALWATSTHLKEYWYCAGLCADLPRNTVRSTTILGVGLVMFRDLTGAPVTLLDQCLHRGTALSAGKLVNGCLQCPYHGWQYDSQGRVVVIPSARDGSDLNVCNAYKQTSFPVCERDDLIWVFMGAGDPKDVAIFDMPFRRDPSWHSYYMISDFEGNVSALAQNFMDVPHTIFVHDKVFRSAQTKTMRTTVKLTGSTVELTYHDEADTIGLMPWLTNPTGAPLTHTDKFLAPNLTRCDYHWGERSGFVITSQMTPTAVEQCRVYTLISYRFPIPKLFQRLLRPLIHGYTRYVINQDLDIMQSNRRGRQNAANPRCHSVEADIVHVGIERLVEAYQAGRALDEGQLGERPMRFTV